MISPEIVEEIKARNDIEDVISSYVSLKRAGSNLNGLCPFHSEKSPSFTVFKGTDSFYCFGCGAGGDVITFIMKVENLDYVGALRFLAARVGIDIPEDNTQNENSVRRTRILEMNREAAKFFFDNLKSSNEALRYCSQRKLDGATLKHFGIGYAPGDFHALTDYMKGKGYSENELITGFLCGKSQKTNGAYDYFRGRLIFPIINTSSEIIGFGGRVLDNSKPKYLNTSDTPAFKKSKNLFALNFAKNNCSDSLILCEGYMDVIALHAAGFENAVATLGTALTPEQARLMKKYTKTVLISYDSDEAGQKAADRAFSILGEAGLETRVLRYEGAKDPDEYIKKFGKLKFQEVIEGSYTKFDYKFIAIKNQFDISTLDGRIKASNAVSDEISTVYSEVERDIYIKKAADELQVSSDSLKRDVEAKRKKNVRKNAKDEERKIISQSSGYGDRVNPQRLSNIKANNAEELILGMMLKHREFTDGVISGKYSLKPGDFITDFSRSVFEFILSCGENFNIGLLNESFSDEQVSRIVKMQIAREGLSNTEKIFEDGIKILKDSTPASDLSITDIINKKRKKFN